MFFRAICLFALLAVLVFVVTIHYPWVVVVIALIYWRNRFGL